LRYLRRVTIDDCDRGEETVTRTRNRLYIPGALGRITQLQAQPVRRGIQAALEITKVRPIPKAFAQLLPRDDLAGPLQQDGEQQQWLGLQLKLDALFSQFTRIHVKLEHPKPNQTLSGTFHHHGNAIRPPLLASGTFYQFPGGITQSTSAASFAAVSAPPMNLGCCVQQVIDRDCHIITTARKNRSVPGA
jgi:hypothetical protein